MQLSIKIDANYEEPETLITTARMTDEVNRIVDFINQSDAVTTIFIVSCSGNSSPELPSFLIQQNNAYNVSSGTHLLPYFHN